MTMPDGLPRRAMLGAFAVGAGGVVAAAACSTDPVSNIYATFSVTNHGAVGDGLTDDTRALQDAIDACDEAGGGIVFLPPGIYGLSETLIINDNGVHLVGSGWENTYLAALNEFGPEDAAITIQGSHRLLGTRIADFQITGDPRFLHLSEDDRKWISIGIEVDSTSLCLIERVRIDHTSKNGIRAANSVGSGPDQLTLRDTRISTCSGTGLEVPYGHSLHVQGGTIEFCSAYGIRFANINSLFVSDMDIESNGAAGVRIDGGRNIVFRNCTFENNGKGLEAHNDELVHIWAGTSGGVQLRSDSCFFDARKMRNIVRIDRGRYTDTGSLIYGAFDSASWVGTGARGAIRTFTRNARAEVGSFGVSWPAGAAADIPLHTGPATRIRHNFGAQTVCWSSKLPAEGVFNHGDLVLNPFPLPGESPGWVCTSAGTAGTLTSVTASVTSGSTTVALSSTSGVDDGDYIVIDGVSGVKRVTGRNQANIVRIHESADATVSSATISYARPTFAAMATVESDGTESAGN